MRERLAELTIDERDGVVIARLTGEVDASNAGDLRLALTERLRNEDAGLVLELSEVGYIDSAGVEFLFDLAARLAARRQSLRIVVPEQAPTRRVLEICDVGQVAALDAHLDGSLRGLARAD